VEPPSASGSPTRHREDLTEDEITWHEGLPTVTVHRAIFGSIELGVGWNLIEQALDTARRQGRLTRRQIADLRALIAEIDAAPAGLTRPRG